MTRRHGYRGRAKAKYNYVRLPVRHRVNAVTRVINDADRARERARVEGASRGARRLQNAAARSTAGFIDVDVTR